VLTVAPTWTPAGPPPESPGLATFRLDARVKTLFDPTGLFPAFPSPESL
jgi:hypothetical protein